MDEELQPLPQEGADRKDIDDLVDRMDRVAILLDKQYGATPRGDISFVAQRTLTVIARTENISVNQVSVVIGRAQSTTSELLARLLKQKLIEQEKKKTDGRVVLLRITAKGRNLLQDARERRAVAWNALLNRLGIVDRTSLVATMTTVCGILNDK